ncbi:uncharacterized protein LOC131624887 [Vicia villosa]|uniref:uncharacterized protein LOC131624887 n=1 Tax=Vicia villosa TaxID=3911 RepID=UPI00273A7CB5|nr:uncharacterized protein LOC131624887 [Vicia villosa]
MNDQQKKEFRNHHKARTILLSSISYTEYEKITNRDSAKDMFDSLRMRHEGNTQVKETKALALIHKYEAFKMEEDETIKTMFSRFQILVTGLKVLDTSLKLAKNLKVFDPKETDGHSFEACKKSECYISLEELIISLRSHEIELEEDEPHKNRKSLALKSKSKFKTNAFQEDEESSRGSSSEEDKLSLISRRVQQLWKHIQRNPRNHRRSNDYSKSPSGYRKSRNKEIICYECNEPGHYKSDCPKLQKEKPKKNSNKEKKKSRMATWDDSESSEEEIEDERANIGLMANISSGFSSSESESNSEVEEVFSKVSRSHLEQCLSEILEKYQKLRIKYKNLKHGRVSDYEYSRKLKAENSDLKESLFKLKNENSVIKDELQLTQKEYDLKASAYSDNFIKEYDHSFQKFLANSIDRSKMASMIYGVSENTRKGIGYVKPKGKEPYQRKHVDDMIIKITPLESHFTYGHTHDIKYTSSSYITNSGEKSKLN